MKFDLEIISPESENRRNWNIPPPKINQNLYQDIKENHYNEFIDNIEKFQSGFNAFGNKWLSYAVEIQNITEREITLPLFDGDNGKESFVNSKALAGYIIEKINGISPLPVTISEHRNSIILQGWTFSDGYPVGLKGKPEDVDKCIELVNRLISDDKKYAGLHSEQENLLKNANFLRSEVNQMLFQV